MTISIIRKETTEDRQRVNAAARRFCNHHNIQILEVDADVFGGNLEDLVDFHINYGDFIDRSEQSAYQRKWTRALCRALKVPYDRRIVLAFGHVGIRID